MKHTKIIVALLLAAFAALACKSEYEVLLEGNDVDAKYAAAFDYFNQGKYLRSAQLFESLSPLTSGTDKADTVQYYWGLSNYRYRDYYTAETNFTNFVAMYPLSPFAPDAGFFRIDCLFRQTLRYELDQKPTNTAIEAIRQYLTENPDTPYHTLCDNMLSELDGRLDRKAYENARLYYKMEDYQAASVALKNVLKDDSENIYREDILYYIAMSSYKYASMSVQEKQKERYLVFVDDYLNFVGEYPESEYRRELDGLYRRVQRILGRNSVIPGMTPEEENGDEIEK
ncbi:MAG: outer membrane protein assembly factor BamD [Bacteroidales bacterium]|nr:outer membrane protein assembly factor BamD [Bacteroidales bacterium]